MRSAERKAFTLLEVMLALGLSVILIIAVGTAINVHFRLLDAGRLRVEQAQLARALLGRIASDLRGAVPYNPIKAEDMVPDLPFDADVIAEAQAAGYDVGSVEGIDLNSLDLSNLDLQNMTLDDLRNMAGGQSGGGGAGSSGGSSSSQTLSGKSTASDDVSGTVVPPEIPGLYGNATEMLIDTSRLPRIDQYDADLGDRLSDVKTVAYYVTDSGLYRREVDRATTAFAAQQGSLADLDAGLEPVAPEVVALEFRYCDGEEWVDVWDSTERDGLPLAVEIGIAVVAPEDVPKNSSTWGAQSPSMEKSMENLTIYRLTVHLPASLPTSGEEEVSE